MEISDVISQRNLKSLVHFTRLDNLDNILKNGIIPRANLANKSYVYNDDYRYDNKLDYSCFSLSFTNDKMFYTLRLNNPDTTWVIILLNVNLLINKPCLFYPCNAASNLVRNNTNLNDFQGGEALEKMFYSEGREEYLTDKFPTDSQAEVMIHGIITPDNITGIIMSDENLIKRYKALYPKFSFKFYEPNTRAFTSRKAFLYGH